MRPQSRTQWDKRDKHDKHKKRGRPDKWPCLCLMAWLNRDVARSAHFFFSNVVSVNVTLLNPYFHAEWHANICSVVIWQKHDSWQLPVIIFPADKQNCWTRRGIATEELPPFYSRVMCSGAANAAYARWSQSPKSCRSCYYHSADWPIPSPIVIQQNGNLVSREMLIEFN